MERMEDKERKRRKERKVQYRKRKGKEAKSDSHNKDWHFKANNLLHFKWVSYILSVKWLPLLCELDCLTRG